MFKSVHTKIFWVYLVGFLVAFHVALPTYVNSSFLSNYFSTKYLGLFYVLSSLLTILGLLFIPRILKKYGNYNTALVLLILQSISLLILTWASSVWLIAIFFILNLMFVPIIYFSADVFLESLSANNQTGIIRGIYLTAVNLAWCFSPLISSLILKTETYSKIFFASFLFLIPAFLIIWSNLKSHRSQHYHLSPGLETFQRIFKQKNLWYIFLANFLLYFFYSWMTIYTPIFLNQEIGLTWSRIGIIFGIMLLPFVIFQLPLGKIADKIIGEKEILSTGFIIMGLATILLSIITSQSIWLWALVLFFTRVGASAVEIMCDTYFFKKVDSLDANLISFYRMSSPIAYVVGPLFATILLMFNFANLRYLFFLLGLICLFGLKFSLNLKDTR